VSRWGLNQDEKIVLSGESDEHHRAPEQTLKMGGSLGCTANHGSAAAGLGNIGVQPSMMCLGDQAILRIPLSTGRR